MNKNVTILIMAGGSGERFWPLSTKEKPKQLLRLIHSERSLIMMAVERVLPLVEVERIFIATNEVQAAAVREELGMIPKQNIILEPAFRDTAAAIGYGCLYIEALFDTPHISTTGLAF
ncbi:MAG: sugar phosphate nucleotidyltransferase [Sphaerochaetaceae bacterium]|nr:sugar phosphate nucleotidyltransferase [Sphaerochaetaceae bacterium]